MRGKLLVSMVLAAAPVMVAGMPKPAPPTVEVNDAEGKLKSLRKVLVLGPDFTPFARGDEAWAKKMESGWRDELMALWAKEESAGRGPRAFALEPSDLAYQEAYQRLLKASWPEGLHRFSSRTGRETDGYKAHVRATRAKLVAEAGAQALLVAAFESRAPRPFWGDMVTWDGTVDELDDDDAKKLVEKGLIGGEDDVPILSFTASLVAAGGDELLYEAVGYKIVMGVRKDARPGDGPPWDFDAAFSDRETKRRAAVLKVFVKTLADALNGKMPKE